MSVEGDGLVQEVVGTGVLVLPGSGMESLLDLTSPEVAEILPAVEIGQVGVDIYKV